MAKKIKKKRTPMSPKLKKTIRKTTAAVLMASAIAVAAIPADFMQANSLVRETGNREFYDTRVKEERNKTTGEIIVTDNGFYRYEISDDRTTSESDSDAIGLEKDSKWKDGEYYTSNAAKGADLARYHRDSRTVETIDDKVEVVEKAPEGEWFENGGYKKIYYTDRSGTNYTINWKYVLSDDNKIVYRCNPEYAPAGGINLFKEPMVSEYYKIPEEAYKKMVGDASEGTSVISYYEIADLCEKSIQNNVSMSVMSSYLISNIFDEPEDDETVGNVDNVPSWAKECLNKNLILKARILNDVSQDDSYITFLSNAYNHKKYELTPVEEREIYELTDPGEPSAIQIDDDMRKRYILTHYEDENFKPFNKFIDEIDLVNGDETIGGVKLRFRLLRYNGNNDSILVDNNKIIYKTDEGKPSYIGDYAFENSEASQIIISRADTGESSTRTKMQAIGDYAFKNAKLQIADLSAVNTIGNAAFKSSNLASVALEYNGVSDITKLASEVFADCKRLSSIQIPYSIAEIGNGAFYNCQGLVSVDLSDADKQCIIHKAAFFDCSSLQNISMPSELGKIEDGVFAVSSSNRPLAVDLPMYLTDIGDKIFSGRSELTSVVFPSEYKGIVPNSTFIGCKNLNHVTFPNASTSFVVHRAAGDDNASEDFVDLFYSVENPKFYVEGPAMLGTSDIANPRKGTWLAIANNGTNKLEPGNDYIPYKTVINGYDSYEIRTGIGGKLAMAVSAMEDGTGRLVSCQRVIEEGDINLVIPHDIYGYNIKSIDSDCFKINGKPKDFVPDIFSITIEDDTIDTIEANAFENLSNLNWLEIGNSVKTIGDNAFLNCDKLKCVTFHSPIGDPNEYTVGTNAFYTNGSYLVFHGDIIEGYGPFDWAMTRRNYIKTAGSESGIHVCYMSPSPSYLMVLYDDNTNKPTLVDYPKYQELDKDHHNYLVHMKDENTSTEETNPSTEETDPSTEETNPSIEKTDSSIEETDPSTGEHDIANAAKTRKHKDTILTALIKPMIVRAEEPNTTSIIYRYEHNLGISPEEEDWIKACQYITVPKGIKSIDVYGYINAPINTNNVNTYLTNRNTEIKCFNKSCDGYGDAKTFVSDAEYTMYSDPNAQAVPLVDTELGKGYINETLHPGLFSGYYREDDCIKKTISQFSDNYYKEQRDRGNDTIISVVLEDIESLPNYAFESCEQLENVSISEDTTRIGVAPFKNALSMKSLDGSDRFFTADGIVYDKGTGDGSALKLVECFTSTQPTKESDEYFAKVFEFEDEAFEDCKNINDMDFSKASFDTISDHCFANSSCKTITLPNTVTFIEPYAFGNVESTVVTIPSEAVAIDETAFVHGQECTAKALGLGDDCNYEENRKMVDDQNRRPTLVSNSALVKKYATKYDLFYSELGVKWWVTFKDYDGTVLNEIEVETDKLTKAGNVNASDIPKPTRPGFVFDYWESNPEGVDPLAKDAITANTTFNAVYYPDPKTHDGFLWVSITNNIDGKEIRRYEDVEVGEVFPNEKHPLPKIEQYAGYEFVGWSEEALNTEGGTITLTSDLMPLTAKYVLNNTNTYTVTFVDGVTLKTIKEFEDVPFGSQFIDLMTITPEAGTDPTVDEDGVPYKYIVPTPPDHTADGYEYLKWSSYDYNYVAKNLTIRAEYRKVDGFLVKFVDWNGNELASKTAKLGESVTPPANPSRDGYIFTGWNTEAYKNVQTDVVVVALYKAIDRSETGPFAVRYYDGVDGHLIKEDKVNKDGSSTPPAAPDHTGYDFDKWSSEDYKSVKSDLAIMALYKVKKEENKDNNQNNNQQQQQQQNQQSSGDMFTVTVVNGTGGGTYKKDAVVSITAAPAEAGKAFSNWSTESQGVALTNAALASTTFRMPGNDVTVTANYVDAASAPVATSPTVTPTTTEEREPETNAQVVVSKPGISNVDMATAKVNGSADSFVVKVTEMNSAEEAFTNALNLRYGSLDNIDYWACDISLYDQTGKNKITDTNGLTVDITLPIPDELRAYGGNVKVGAVGESGSLEELSTRFNTINGIPCVSFTAPHLSPYGMFVETDHLDAGKMLDATPKTGDPIHPKWFLAIALACTSIILFIKKDKKIDPKTIKIA